MRACSLVWYDAPCAYVSLSRVMLVFEFNLTLQAVDETGRIDLMWLARALLPIAVSHDETIVLSFKWH